MPLSNDGDKRQEGNVCIAEEEEEEEEKEDTLVSGQSTPPDGGWGWWVVLASFLCNMIVDGVCFSFGVVTKQYQKEFGASHSQVGWVGSSLAGCYLLVGPFVSALNVRYGCRCVTMLGSVVAMVGFGLSAWSTSVWMLILTYGVIGGVGFGMIYLPSIVCVGQWFEKKRAFTTGIAVCGTGMGQLVFPPLAYYLLTEYGWEGKNIIMAGIVLHCAVCGMMFLPFDHQQFNQRKRMKNRNEIERGAIMKALIEDKKRQRTISNGSLDNCVITRDNRLIKLNPTLLECKRNNSFIARFKRQLGFSSQSLASSKSSIQIIPSIVIDAVQKDLNKTAAVTPIYKPNGITGREHQTQLAKKRGSLPDGYILKSSSLGTNGSILTANGFAKLNGVVKTRSCDVIPNDENWWTGQLPDDEAITFQVQPAGGKITVSRSASDLESLNSVEGSIISIQLIETASPDQHSLTSVRYRSSQSTASGYTSQLASSNISYVTGSLLSIPQMNTSGTDLERKLHQSNPLFWKYWLILCDMFDVRLMLNPVFALLVFSSFVTMLAFYVPFFYLPNKGEIVGMSESAATFLLSIVGATNTIGRLLCGWLADRPWMNKLHLNNCALILAGITILLCPFCEGEKPLAALSAVFGLCVAVYVSLRSVLLVDLLGLEMLNKSFGLLILFQGVAAFIGAPIAGSLRDATGDVNHCFYLAGGLTILSGLLMLPILQLRKAETSKKLAALVSSDVPITETSKKLAALVSSDVPITETSKKLAALVSSDVPITETSKKLAALVSSDVPITETSKKLAALVSSDVPITETSKKLAALVSSDVPITETSKKLAALVSSDVPITETSKKLAALVSSDVPITETSKKLAALVSSDVPITETSKKLAALVSSDVPITETSKKLAALVSSDVPITETSKKLAALVSSDVPITETSKKLAALVSSDVPITETLKLEDLDSQI